MPPGSRSQDPEYYPGLDCPPVDSVGGNDSAAPTRARLHAERGPACPHTHFDTRFTPLDQRLITTKPNHGESRESFNVVNSPDADCYSHLFRRLR
jgi:hypothetical protein